MSKVYFILFLTLISSISTISQNKEKERHTPKGRTKNINLNEWDQKAKTNALDLNENWKKIDEKLYELVIKINPYFFEIVNDSLRFSNLLSGHNCFDSTDVEDIVNIPGLKKEDVVIVAIWDNIPIIQDALGVQIENDYFICKRSSGGSDVLYYTWLWIKNE
ncbi:MAG: hypothetical protein WC346_20530 [Methanogenium sp.]|jgi:hypothetical protein